MLVAVGAFVLALAPAMNIESVPVLVFGIEELLVATNHKQLAILAFGFGVRSYDTLFAW